ncbi:DinB family protein [Phycicoccus sonneratiae]|uniref:DinB family protein n=1 Tax=Phycicoccus sonneratiae TaxID=2807628 RepID=A0ABS2CHQ0_9MICO|nr:DinB family protein [Phycicoccus sonneraticus]MBM6399409.1 DinB family protein [Phycicoccus sonneraticus]
MPATRTRPPKVADERTQLLGWYDLQRGICRLKAEGLTDDQAHRALLPTSPLMTVAGIVSHLAWAEDLWFREVLLGEPGLARGFEPGAPDDAEFRVEGVPLATLLEEYDAACARSDAAIAGRSLDDTGSTVLHAVGEASLRWMLHHMLEETARHAGHLDLLREMLDGEVGYY